MKLNSLNNKPNSVRTLLEVSNGIELNRMWVYYEKLDSEYGDNILSNKRNQYVFCYKLWFFDSFCTNPDDWIWERYLMNMVYVQRTYLLFPNKELFMKIVEVGVYNS